jgi:GDP-mannose 4,6-dehydratase
MRFFITGATGFVGSHMVDYLLEENPNNIIFASRRWRSDDSNIKHLYGNERVKFIEADLLDRGSLRTCIESSSPDYVFHFASQSYPMASFSSPVATLMTNGIGTINLLDEIRGARDKGICDPIIISVSSSEVYGNPAPDEIPITEQNPIRAANPYSISKVTHDLMSQYYFSSYGLKIIVTRLFSHEGKRRGRLFAISNFAYQIASVERLYHRGAKLDPTHTFTIKVGNLHSVRTYSHIDDAIKAYWLVATKGIIGEVYNIGGKDACTVGEALEDLLKRSYIPRERFRIEVDEKRIRPTDITLQIPDCSKFKKLTNWEPEKTLGDINEDLLQYWRNQL